MGYKAKKPKGLKIAKTSSPPSDYAKSIFDYDGYLWTDSQIIDYLKSQRQRELPPWTANYDYTDFYVDFSRYNKYRDTNYNFSNPIFGYQLLTGLSRRNRYTGFE